MAIDQPSSNNVVDLKRENHRLRRELVKTQAALATTKAEVTQANAMPQN